jgi:hypothetical protein
MNRHEAQQSGWEKGHGDTGLSKDTYLGPWLHWVFMVAEYFLSFYFL